MNSFSGHIMRRVKLKHDVTTGMTHRKRDMEREIEKGNERTFLTAFCRAIEQVSAYKQKHPVGDCKIWRNMIAHASKDRVGHLMMVIST